MFTFRSIRQKLFFGFGIVLALILVLGIYNYMDARETKQDMEELMDDQLSHLILDDQLYANMEKQGSYLRGYFLFNDDKALKRYQDSAEEGIVLDKKILEISSNPKIKDVTDRKITWGEMNSQAISLYQKGKEKEAFKKLRNEINPETDKILTELKELSDHRADEITKLVEEIKKQASVTQTIAVIISLAALIIGALVAIVIARKISGPIRLLNERMKQLAAGELDHEPLQISTQDEMRDLVDSANRMNEHIHELLREISEVAGNVTGQSEELSQSANEVKSGSEQVAITMEELASGAETQANRASDLSSMMQAFTSRAEQANEGGLAVEQASQEVLEMTRDGVNLMEQSTAQMKRIDTIVHNAVEKVAGLDAQSQEISKLVSVIQDIAEQTNLLALNAAIEAARAGENGKGFAVVADEVRKLAEQVSHSVTDITGIVANIQSESNTVAASLQEGYSEVTKGTEQIEETGTTFEHISEAIQDVTASIQTVAGHLKEITSSSEEMRGFVEEIAAVSEESAAGIEQTSASSQQTSSAMEEVANSSQDLSELAEKMNTLVSRFKI